MRAFFNLFGKRSTVPPGFHDYRPGELADAFGINDAQGAEVLRDYHALLHGRSYFGQASAAADGHALMNAAVARFGVHQQAAARIALWFGRLIRLTQERSHAAGPVIATRVWISVCQHGAPGGYSDHASYDGKQFDAQTGLLIGPEHLFPGALIGCKCNARAIIAGFEE